MVLHGQQRLCFLAAQHPARLVLDSRQILPAATNCQADPGVALICYPACNTCRPRFLCSLRDDVSGCLALPCNTACKMQAGVSLPRVVEGVPIPKLLRRDGVRGFTDAKLLPFWSLRATWLGTQLSLRIQVELFRLNPPQIRCRMGNRMESSALMGPCTCTCLRRAME